MKNQFKMDNKGSITVLLMLMMPVFLILGGVVLDRAEFYHAYRSYVRENELRLSAEFRRFDRDLFDRFGLLAVRSRQTNIHYTEPLGKIQNLEESIVGLMRYRVLNDSTILGAEAVASNQIVKNLLKIREEVDETIAFKDAINRGIAKGTIPSPADLGRLVKKVMRNTAFFYFPYSDFNEIFSLADGTLIELEASRVIKEIEWEYFDCFSELELNSISEKFLIAAYTVDYLGYSSNISKKEIFTAEYVLSGFPSIEYQTPVVRTELVMVRTLLNAASLLADPRRMESYLIKSGGDVRLQLLYLAADAIRLGIQDLDTLVDGGKIPIFKTADQLDQKDFKSGMYYKEYLEILLMMMPRDLMLERIQNSISIEGIFNLDEYYTAMDLSDRFRYEFHFFGGVYEKEQTFSIEF